MTEPKPTHGGRRAGAGRPPSPYPERLIKIRCTDAEYQAIIESTDPRRRAELLIDAKDSQ